MSVVEGSEADAERPREEGGPGSARRRAREVALQVLYAIDLIQHRPRPPGGDAPDTDPLLAAVSLDTGAVQTPAEIFEAVVDHFPIPARARGFALELVREVRSRAEALDDTIGRHSQNWRVARMAAVDRNILRLGVYELTCTDTPAPVVLNESVDLARRFGGDPSPAFVNGILDAVSRSSGGGGR